MKKIFFIILFIASPAFAENYLLNGGQESQIKYQMVQKIDTPPEIKTLFTSCVVPKSFDSPTYSQKISDFDIHFNPAPLDRIEKTDIRGNKAVEARWEAPIPSIIVTISMTAKNSVKLTRLQTNAPFPPVNLPDDVKVYLKETEQVASNDHRIRAKAAELTASAKTEFDAVQQILAWVIDHLRYVLTPENYGAIYSLQTGKGNCQNYSHLSAALMRATGIPARIINGISLKQPYDIKIGNAVQTMRMGEGRHSWIEVYFPGLGWIPFDPQQTELFVSNRFIRIEVGLDNNETKQDGLISWHRSSNTSEAPHFQENIKNEFVFDKVDFIAKKMNFGPRSILLSPEVAEPVVMASVTFPQPPDKKPESPLAPLPEKKAAPPSSSLPPDTKAVQPSPPTTMPSVEKPVSRPVPPTTMPSVEKPVSRPVPPTTIPSAEKPISRPVPPPVSTTPTSPPPQPPKKKTIKTPAKKEDKPIPYSEPYLFGNLEFPENVDFLSTRGPAQQGEAGTMEMRKNFLVETAEYVTTLGQQYAQTFILKKPMELKRAGIALRKFSDDGQLWIELFQDDHGKPGTLIDKSEILQVSRIQRGTGYSWVDFDFSKSSIKLSPGRYWLALGFTEAPIVNWFFTYGKPTGPEDGTRYKTIFDETWSRSLSYEFNYRLEGRVQKEMMNDK